MQNALMCSSGDLVPVWKEGPEDMPVCHRCFKVYPELVLGWSSESTVFLIFVWVAVTDTAL
jgi:hypothetical protein